MKSFTKVVSVAAVTLALASGFMLAGCSSSSSSASASASASASGSANTPAVQLQVFGANSLQKALPEVQALYTKANPNVTFADSQFDGSGGLVTKIKDGAPADILITASQSTMDTANTNGSVDPKTITTMFKNDLVIVSKTGSGVTISSLDDLKSDAIASIAIGDPNLVPAGKYALQCLENAGLVTYETVDGTIQNIVWDESIASKMNAGASGVGTVAKYISGGECQVGFVYSSDVYRYDNISAIFTTPADSHKEISYPGAVVSTSANPEVAEDFLRFCVNNADAQKIFSNYGFELA